MKTRMMSFALAVVLVGSSFTLKVAHAEEDALGITRVSGSQLLAVQSAYRAFERYGYDLRRFKLIVAIRGDDYEVIFVPLPTEEEATTDFGGELKAGREVHYFVSKDSFEIVRHHFAR